MILFAVAATALVFGLAFRYVGEALVLEFVFYLGVILIGFALFAAALGGVAWLWTAVSS